MQKKKTPKGEWEHGVDDDDDDDAYHKDVILFVERVARWRE